MGENKCDSCDERGDYMVQFMANGDEGDNPYMTRRVYCCGSKLKKICEEGDFGKGPGDSVIDMETHELYDNFEAAEKREGAVYIIPPERYLEWSLRNDEKQAVF